MKNMFFAISLLLVMIASWGCSDDDNNPISSGNDEVVFSAENYFPLKIGSEWFYSNYFNGQVVEGVKWTSRITGTKDFDGKKYFIFSGIDSTQKYFYRIENNIVYYKHSDFIPESVPVYDFNRTSGESYKTDDYTTMAYMGMETVTTLAGKFEKCAKFKEIYNNGDSEYDKYFWLAPNVGIVKEDVGAREHGLGWWELINYTIPSDNE